MLNLGACINFHWACRNLDLSQKFVIPDLAQTGTAEINGKPYQAWEIYLGIEVVSV
jgi:hypothetical protein